jgi:hypothetical protein
METNESAADVVDGGSGASTVWPAEAAELVDSAADGKRDAPSTAELDVGRWTVAMLCEWLISSSWSWACAVVVPSVMSSSVVVSVERTTSVVASETLESSP